MSVMTTLVPVIVGGVIGLAGGLLGPPLTHWLNKKTDRKKREAQKLEELIDALYEYSHWLASIQNIRVFGHEMPEKPNPISKAIAITAIHFPQFNSEILELELMTNSYHQWMFSRARARLDGTKSGELTQGFSDAYKPFLEKFNVVVKRLKDYAEAEFVD